MLNSNYRWAFPVKGLFLVILLGGSLFWSIGEPGEVAKNGASSVSRQAQPNSAYELQLNSFKVRSNANRFVERLEKKGYKPFMTYTREKEPWYKVRLGPYASWDSAKKVSEELKKNHGLPSLVLLSAENTVAPAVSKVSLSGSESPGPSRTQKTKTLPSRKTSPAAVAPENAGNSIDIVLSQFLVWRTAWQEKQVDNYFSFYSKKFQSGGPSFKDWEQAKRESLAKASQIKIEVDDIDLVEKGDTIEMSFIETYQADSISDIRRKVLVWKKENGMWKIIGESSEPA